MINLTFIVAGNTTGAPDPSIYKQAAKRFAASYKAYPPEYAHRLILINSNGGLTDDVAANFSDIPHEVIVYRGSGWDIGGHHFAAFTLPPDEWIMGLSSWTHFRRPGWLKAFAEAREKFGDGLFGSTSSFEKRPHIRGTGYLIRCGRIHRYPHGCNSREESLTHEAGETSLTDWCINEGYGAWLVTPEKTVPLAESRSLPNIFRRGDQSNIWIYDKHTEVYDNAAAKEKTRLELLADYNQDLNLMHPRRRFFKRRSWKIISKIPVFQRVKRGLVRASHGFKGSK